jgi:omega-6 fatty acid desaturase (delta-12 desaturase)
MALHSGTLEEATLLRPEDYGFRNIPGAPEPGPLERPSFSLKDIRDSVPQHCFTRSLLTSSYCLLTNLFFCLALFCAATYISYFPIYISILLWPAYWFLEGAYMTGLWVLAHECGHQAFSDHQIINDTIGLVLHSFLLVPYHSWKITHRRHHLNTGSCENDEVFAPFSRTRLTQELGADIIEESPLRNFIHMIGMLLIGWMPFYLVFNSKGPEKYIGQNANHFSPTAAMFLPKHYNDIVLSDVGFFIVLGGLISLGMNYGIANVMFYYGVPYLVVNYHLVLITFLQHTDTYVPHFRSKEWSWLRGAMCTVDRSFGKWLDGVFHHISDTHVCHHLFPSMPFYHAEEATLAISKVLGKYRLKDDTPIWTALWRSFTNCKFVEDNGSIVFYKKSLK